MLYQMYDMQRSMLRPMRLAAWGIREMAVMPFSPLTGTPLGRFMAASAEMFDRTTRRYEKPEFGLATTVVDGQTLPVTERVVAELPFCRLLHFQVDAPRRRPRVLIVAPLSGHHATLLRGTVEAMLPGHDVYITDWLDARLVPATEGRFGMDEYIDYLIGFLRVLGPNTHMMAVCQPVVPVIVATALMAEDGDAATPRSMTLMGGPVDTAAAPTKVTELAESHPLSWFERRLINIVPFTQPGAGRRVYAGFLQLSGFMSLQPERHATAHISMFRHLVLGDGDSAEKHRQFYDEYMTSTSRQRAVTIH